MKMTSQPIQRRLALIPALLFCVLLSDFARADLSNGSVGWWKLNETSGTTALDSSGSGNHGTLSTNMTPVSGALVGGTALFFNGAERVSVSDSPSLNMTAGISIGAWVKAENWNSPSVILSKGTGVAYQYLLQAASGYLMFNLNGGFPGPIELTTSLPSTGVWHHIAGTFDGSQIALYLDGMVVTQRVATGSIVSSTSQLNIGAILGPPNPYAFFTGAISDVRVYNRALSSNEVQTMLLQQPQLCVSPPSGQIAWWPGDGNTNDIQGTNNGALINGVTFAPGKVGQAFQFNGGNYVQIQGNEALSPTNISVEGWFNVASQNNGPALVGTYYGGTPQAPAPATGWSLLISSGLRPDFTLSRGATSVAVISAVPITLNTWVHIAATYDGTNASIFINGALQGTAAFPGGYTPSSAPMLIGAASWCESYGCGIYNFRLTGYVDELSIYNRALTASEIQAIYAADSAGMCKAPVIFTQPTSQTVVTNSSTTFTVSASGLLPLYYQWRFNVTNLLSGQTNSSLLLTNISLSQAGTYSVHVSNKLGFVISSNAILTVYVAGLDYDSDGLLNEQEIQFGTNPFLADTDGDGINDYNELFIYATNPLLADTDGDGMLDGWEVQHGLNARSNDASDDLDGDGISNLAEYNWSLSHTNQLIDSRTKYSTSLSTSDYAVVNGAGTNWFLYDRNNRLIGAEFDRGLALAYVYDGNDNLVRQVSMKHDANTNGLPDVWEFLNGLTNNASAYTDTDGDGWTDYQEWKAGTNPRDPQSAPNLLENSGAQIALLQLPFTPSNFVAGVGQLDGLGAEEIVLGADGNPGTNTNWLLVLTQGATTWSTQRVDVGPFGITSIAVGQPTNRPSAGIYVGLRGTTNGSGRVIEFTSNGGIWQSNVVALSTNQAAFVLGVRGPDVLVSLGTTNVADGALYGLDFSNSWSIRLLDTRISNRGLGTIGSFDSMSRWPLRLLDTNGIQVGYYVVPDLVAYYPFDGNANDASGNGNNATFVGDVTNAPDRFGRAGMAAFVRTDGTISLPSTSALQSSAITFSFWYQAETNILADEPNYSICVLLNSAPDHHPLLFMNASPGSAPPGTPAMTLGYWNGNFYGANYIIPIGQWTHFCLVINGLSRNIHINGSSVFQANDYYGNSGYPVTEIGNFSGDPNTHSARGAFDDVRIYNRALTSEEIATLGIGANPVLALPEPSAILALNWRGGSLASGTLRGTNGNSVFYAFADDKNQDGLLGFGDEFAVSEYLVSGTNASLLTLFRQPIAALNPAQSYGLASVNFLNASNEVFFTGEPDGQVFAWTSTGATNPLQRQLFSGQHAGKAWHALASVKTLEPGEGLIGLRVDPISPNKCDVIFWSPQSQLAQLANLPNTAPAAAVLPATNTLGSLALVTVRLWDAEGNASTPFLQYQLSGSTNWQSATLVNLDGGVYSASTRVAASPGGVNHTVVWNVQTNLGANIVTNILLRARASDFALLGDWSAGTPFQVNTVTGPDADGDGLPDWWESQYFGSTSANPNDDPDGDGFKNWQEYIADTNPTNTASHLSLSVSLLSDGVKLDWLAGSNSWKYLQRTASVGITNQPWLDIWTSPPPPGADSGSYTDFFGTNAFQFYRIRVTR